MEWMHSELISINTRRTNIAVLVQSEWDLFKDSDIETDIAREKEKKLHQRFKGKYLSTSLVVSGEHHVLNISNL